MIYLAGKSQSRPNLFSLYRDSIAAIDKVDQPGLTCLVAFGNRYALEDG
jgi:hypothetical protein